MKAVVFHDVGDIRLDDVDEPKIQEPTDAIVRITASAICGTDLHMVRGTMPGMKPGTILGHEGVGVVEEVGPSVRNLQVGDRVVIPSTIACGYCSYCRAGYHAQCDNANPGGKRAGTAFFGGPESAGGFHGLQAEYARIPFANTGPVLLPEEIDDNRAILLSDVFPTGYFGADIARIEPGHTVAVFGCGPVGLFAVLSAHLFRAGRVFAIDHRMDRLEMARGLGAEVIDFSADDPVEVIVELTGGIGVDRVIDAVGVDAEKKTNGHQLWEPGDAPTQALEWAVQCLAKAGTLSVIGVYPPTVRAFPIGDAMMKNLKLHMGNCNHRRYIPELVDLVLAGAVDPLAVLTEREPMVSAIDAYEHFDRRDAGWVKVELTSATSV